MSAASSWVSVVVGAAPERVHAFARDPRNLPRWAAGVGARIEERDGRWIVPGGPLGEIEIRFAADEAWGVLDHEVLTADGRRFHNPVRVVEHPDGAEVVFGVRRTPGAPDADHAADVAAVLADLERLRDLLEVSDPPGPPA
ncbi:SRPBCC family protein [Pseudonocardia sp. ICBG1293]|uniref:SRPBCC family protein n=1 Tax=Pseudonocardia sp. ICBG1293 TaxID=2844382 RepID=UPI001CCF72AB|nr:SRPBCC family protein [Pseudonocardia sp. ICBG1293]